MSHDLSHDEGLCKVHVEIMWPVWWRIMWLVCWVIFCSDFQLFIFPLQKCVLDFSRKCTQLGRAMVVWPSMWRCQQLISPLSWPSIFLRQLMDLHHFKYTWANTTYALPRNCQYIHPQPSSQQQAVASNCPVQTLPVLQSTCGVKFPRHTSHSNRL